jgi:hypothetical protein
MPSITVGLENTGPVEDMELTLIKGGIHEEGNLSCVSPLSRG